jgi:hypothetical protein
MRHSYNTTFGFMSFRSGIAADERFGGLASRRPKVLFSCRVNEG